MPTNQPPEALERLQRNGVVVSLYPWEEELAERVGTGRDYQNRSRNDRISYDAERLMSSNLLASIHAVVAEIGVSRVLGAYCYAGLWRREDHNQFSSLPDVQWGRTEVEVKWRRAAWSMPVDAKDAETNRLVIWAESILAKPYECVCDFCVEHNPTSRSRVRVLGGGWAGMLWGLGVPYGDDMKRMKVGVSHLRSIQEILA